MAWLASREAAEGEEEVVAGQAEGPLTSVECWGWRPWQPWQLPLPAGSGEPWQLGMRLRVGQRVVHRAVVLRRLQLPAWGWLRRARTSFCQQRPGCITVVDGGARVLGGEGLEPKGLKVPEVAGLVPGDVEVTWAEGCWSPLLPR